VTGINLNHERTLSNKNESIFDRHNSISRYLREELIDMTGWLGRDSVWRIISTKLRVGPFAKSGHVRSETTGESHIDVQRDNRDSVVAQTPNYLQLKYRITVSMPWGCGQR
jgi:hypothetical protein